MHRLAGICESRPDIVGLYIHHPRAEPPVVAALCRYVHEGGALLAIHGASASFKGSRSYSDLLGASFIGHRPISRRTFRLVTGGLPSHLRLPESVAVTDEVYEHEFHGDPDIWYRWDDLGSPGSAAPAVWTRRYGEGRVACMTPGHRAAVWRTQGVAEVISAVVTWLLRTEISS